MVNISSTSGELFYDKICSFIFQYVTSPTVQGTFAEADLCEFITVWQSYKIMTKWIWHLFMHLETSVIKLNDLLTLTAVALVNFHKHVYQRHHQSLTSLTLGCILREREGEDVDRSLLQESLQVRRDASADCVCMHVKKRTASPVPLFAILHISLKSCNTDLPDDGPGLEDRHGLRQRAQGRAAQPGRGAEDAGVQAPLPARLRSCLPAGAR
jgi:hypothetical protein